MCFYGTRETTAVIAVHADEDLNKRPPSRFIFIQAISPALLCPSYPPVKGLWMVLKPWKPGEYREQSDSCGDAITFNKKRKLNTPKEQPSVKKLDHGGPCDITKAGLGWAFIGCRFLKGAWKGNHTLKFVSANQAVSAGNVPRCESQTYAWPSLNLR